MKAGFSRSKVRYGVARSGRLTRRDRPAKANSAYLFPQVRFRVMNQIE
jgi:hypothetical protein